MIYFFAVAFVLLLLLKPFLNKKVKVKKNSFALKSKRFFIFSNEYQTLKSNILNKLKSNIANKFNQKIDFLSLKNANLFENKEIFKIVVGQTNFWKKQFLVFKSLKESKNFTLVFQVKSKSEEVELCEFLKQYDFKNFRIVNLKDINFKLLFEINKLNINYEVETENKQSAINNQNFSLPRLKNGCLACEAVSKKYECTFEQFASLNFLNIFNLNFSFVYVFCVKAKQNVCISLQAKVKMPAEFDFFKPFDFSKFLHSNFKIANVKKVKTEGEYFFVATFKNFQLKKGKTKNIVLSQEKINFECVKNIKMQSYLNLKNLINFNFLSKNEEKNAFFNKKLPIFIQKLVLNKSCCLNFQNKKLKNLEDVCSVFENFLGLKQCNNFLEIKPKFDFSINLNGMQIETKSGEENSVEINGVRFVNLNKIDLNLLNTNKLTFVYKNVL